MQLSSLLRSGNVCRAERLQTSSPGDFSEVGENQTRAARLTQEKQARCASAFTTHSIVNRVIITQLKRDEKHVAHKQVVTGEVH